MGDNKRDTLWCRKCDALSKGEGDFTCIGSCMDCAEYDLVDNLLGLWDEASVPYKRWQVAYNLSRPGRPRNTTPPAGWKINELTLGHQMTGQRQSFPGV